MYERRFPVLDRERDHLTVDVMIDGPVVGHGSAPCLTPRVVCTVER
jgi:hypothetical protein